MQIRKWPYSWWAHQWPIWNELIMKSCIFCRSHQISLCRSLILQTDTQLWTCSVHLLAAELSQWNVHSLLMLEWASPGGIPTRGPSLWPSQEISFAADMSVCTHSALPQTIRRSELTHILAPSAAQACKDVNSTPSLFEKLIRYYVNWLSINHLPS